MKRYLKGFSITVFCLSVGCFFAWDAGLFWSTSFKKTYQSAEQGDDFSQLTVGETFLLGRSGVRGNKKKAIYWLDKAARQGNSEIQYFVSLFYRDHTPYTDKAIYWLTKAAREGYRDAQRILGYSYTSEYSFTKKDLAKAIYWLTKASEQGAYQSQYELGKIYYYDDGGYKNEKMALKWLLAAAVNGHSHAGYLVGNMFYDGIGVEKNRSAAAALWLKAAKKGSWEAQYRLGVLYYNGGEVEQNFKQSYIWCGLAARTYGEHNQRAKEIMNLSKQHLSDIELVEAEESLNTIWDENRAIF